jgi:hypothetical protein
MDDDFEDQCNLEWHSRNLVALLNSKPPNRNCGACVAEIGSITSLVKGGKAISSVISNQSRITTLVH